MVSVTGVTMPFVASSQSLTVIEERTVGPELGEDYIRSGARAMIIGLTIVLLFMVAYYKLSGFIADCALFVNRLGNEIRRPVIAPGPAVALWVAFAPVEGRREVARADPYLVLGPP